MLSRLQNDPLRALIYLEIGAVLATYVFDVVVVLLRFMPHISFTLISWGAFTALVAVAAVAIFGIPHAPNRKFGRLAIGVIALFLLTLFPEDSLSGAVLFTVLACRLTFAFGFLGAATAWGTAMVSVCAMGIWQLASHQTNVTPTIAAFEVVDNFLIITIVFGIIAIVWLYANKAVSNAASAERARIALDLHDSLGHSLTTLNVQLQNAERLRAADPAKADAYVKRAAATACEVLEDVRETVTLLHDDATAAPPPLPLLLERLHTDFAATHNLEVKWRAHFTEEPSGRIAMALYRVMQEALTNVARHARAKRVEVSVLGRDGKIELLVRDDGAGFENATRGHGLASMRTRIESIGGTFMIASRRGDGTCIQAQLPLEARA